MIYDVEQQLAVEAEEMVLARQGSRDNDVFIREYNELRREEEMKLTNKDRSDNR